MLLKRIKIENFRGLRDLDIPLSQFVCLIGENNAGKSSVLQAVLVFLNGSTLARTHYFDDTKDIRIELEFTDITAPDLLRLAEEHRPKIAAILANGVLTLVRVFGQDGKSKLRYRARRPTDTRFSDEAIDTVLKGKKPGATFVTAVSAAFPEIAAHLTITTNQTEARQLLDEYKASLPDNQTILTDCDLPTGIDKSISGLLPEPIYIPAVKDLRDDIKTSDSTPFGKILGMLLRAIEPKLGDIKALFASLDRSLNRIIQPDGTFTDDRLQEVRNIESIVDGFVRESFSNVGIRIAVPPPELKTILSAAQVYANDGVEGLIESKGDGLRRAVVFAVLRAFVRLNKPAPGDGQQAAAEPSYLLLFEEPELYLHPKGQQILFETLSTFSKSHHVIVTTHSPAFFGPGATTAFIKLRKTNTPGIAKPHAVAHPVDLGDVTAKDQFQIICYENNSVAFFADTVALVEGDSDLIVFPHVARLLNPAWDTAKSSVRFAKINGKTSIRRYREFFSRFDMRVLVIADLDVLVRGIEQLGPTPEIAASRESLLRLVDSELDRAGGPAELNARGVKDAQERGDVKALWRRAKQSYEQFKVGTATYDQFHAAVEDFFAWEKSSARLQILQQPGNPDIVAAKKSLIDALRAIGVCVLSKGELEDYYPGNVPGSDKPSKAQGLCNGLTCRQHVIDLCPPIAPDTKCEFEQILEVVFRN
ncbi:MAG: ATP-dependent endonuclease [Fimbriimonadaceae bacterium]|nr:ATP-dependent endonuclease [Fimbriimonadaceae bacterium]